MVTEFVTQPEGKKRLDVPKRRPEGNVQMILGKTELEVSPGFV